MDYDQLKINAWERRLEVLEMVYRSGAGHIGGSFSCMDILTVLYHEVMDAGKILRRERDRDRFVLSKGHCAEALYAVLAAEGFFPREELASFAAFGSRLAGHPSVKAPGIEIGTGALGHGLSVAAGMAYGLKQDGAGVYVLLGDGELAEGSVWEAAMAAAKFGLGNLCAVIDRNGLQISGETETVMPLESLEEKFAAFGWAVTRCRGHEPSSLLEALDRRSFPPGEKPRAVIAETVKGYGTAVLAGNPECHHLIPNEEQYKQIKADLQAKIMGLRGSGGGVNG